MTSFGEIGIRSDEFGSVYWGDVRIDGRIQCFVDCFMTIAALAKAQLMRARSDNVLTFRRRLVYDIASHTSKESLGKGTSDAIRYLTGEGRGEATAGDDPRSQATAYKRLPDDEWT